MLSLKGRLQQAHLCLLVLIPVLYAILKITSGAGDPIVSLISKVLFLSGSFWAAFIAAHALRRGSKEAVVTALLNQYRRTLQTTSVLIASDVGLVIISVTLIIQLSFYRSVEVQSNSNVKLFVRSGQRNTRSLGTVVLGKNTSYRLRVGVARLTYSDREGEEFTPLAPVVIRPFWKAMDPIYISVPEGHGQYEKLLTQ